MRWVTALVWLLVSGFAPAASAQEDAEGSKDHPMVSRMPGYHIHDYQEQEFGAHDFDLGEDKSQRVEGRYWKIAYAIKEGGRPAGPLQIARNYANAFTKRGGTKLLEDVNAGGGRMLARLPAEGKHVWLEVQIANSGELYDLTVVEEASMKQDVEFTATELAKMLREAGTVALRGILFDTGQAVIKPESAATLKEVGAVLKNDPTLALEIQGHTDNVGAAAANMKLSQDRADAVKTWLVTSFGIDEGRLTTAGLGGTKPVADNSTEEGRAKNRRVELVKKP